MHPKMIVDRERAWFVFGTLLDAWRKKLPPFDRVEPVPSRIPPNIILGSVEHALFLFCSCYYMRGKIDSATALFKLSYMYEESEHLFNPNTYVATELELGVIHYELVMALRKHGLGFNASETSKFWILNFQKLNRFWEGNPILFYERTKSYEELCNVLIAMKKNPENPNGFYAFRHKMVSMLSYFYGRAGIIDPFGHSAPIDFHWCRVGVATGIIRGKDIRIGAQLDYYKVSKPLRKLSVEFCKTADELMDLADAVWHHSREFCSSNQGNSSIVSKNYEARRTEITPRVVVWNEAEIERYNNSCGLCQLEDHCKWSIPSADNYVRGVIYIRGSRPRPHASQVKLLEVPKVLRRRPELPQLLPAGKPHEHQVALF